MQFFSLFRYFLSFHTYHPKRNWVVLWLIQLFNIWKPRLFERSLCESTNYGGGDRSLVLKEGVGPGPPGPFPRSATATS